MLYYMISESDTFLFVLIGIAIIVLIFVNKNKIFNTFQNNENQTELDENGFIRNELKPSYWYKYAPSEIRSKCFDCDASSNLMHASNCIDCEMKGGRPVDKLFNRVLTR